MDQDGFRNLLSSGAGGSGSKRVLGGPAPKRGTAWGIKPKPGNEYKPPKEASSTDFAPRQNKKAKLQHGKYMDRAEMRRRGVDDEYKPVENMLRDFEERQEREGKDAEEIERNRAYLGGDAEHSILVKGLDYSLLAATKAELAAKGEEVADEELEALVQKKSAKPEQVEKNKDETLGMGFKAINKKDEAAEGEKKKKKKKKKAKVEPDIPLETAPAMITAASPKAEPGRQKDVENPAVGLERGGPSRPRLPTPPPIDDDEDIFGDVGTYDLGVGRPDDSDSEEGEAGDGVNATDVRRSRSRTRSRSPGRRSRSRSREYDRYGDRRYRSRSRSLERRYRSRSRDHERYDDRRDRRSVSRGDYRGRDRRDERYSPPRRYRGDDRQLRSRSRSPYYRRRSPSPHRRRERSYSRDRPYSRERRRSHSRSPSPPRCKSPSPTTGTRKRTRSPSPFTFDAQPVAMSRSPSPSSDEGEGLTRGGKLQPLQSSAISDLKGFLSADQAAAKAEDKRLKKAKWRAQQGLPPSEGTEGAPEKSMNDKQKMNRDYVLLMNKMNKDKPEGDKE